MTHSHSHSRSHPHSQLQSHHETASADAPFRIDQPLNGDVHHGKWNGHGYGEAEAEHEGEEDGLYHGDRLRRVYAHGIGHHLSHSHPFLRILYRYRLYILLAFVTLCCWLIWTWIAISLGVKVAESMDMARSARSQSASASSLSRGIGMDDTMRSMGQAAAEQPSGSLSLSASSGASSALSSTSSSLPAASRGRLLLCNSHSGLQHEIFTALSSAVPNHVQQMSVRRPVVYEVIYELAEKQWNEERWQADCRAYEYIIVADTVPKGRPYLQHVDECTAAGAKIIVLVTNRYDWDIYDDRLFHYMFSHASRNPHVRVVQNNPYEEYYANVLKRSIGPSIRFDGYIPSTGKPGLAWVQGMYEEEKQRRIGDDDVDQLHHPSHVGKEDVDVWLHEYPIGLTNHTFVWPWYGKKKENKNENARAMVDEYGSLHDQSIFMLPKPYGGPLTLSHRIVLFIPYQVNTMALFENLYHNVTYILPSARLYARWSEEKVIGICVPPQVPLQDYETYIDWWRKDLQQFFYYFDDLRELVRDSPLRRRIKAEHKEHIERQWRYMNEEHYPMVKQKWIKLFDEFSSV